MLKEFFFSHKKYQIKLTHQEKAFFLLHDARYKFNINTYIKLLFMVISEQFWFVL